MKQLICILVLIVFFASCNLGSTFEKEFKIHTEKADVIIFNGDHLQPEKVYLKDNGPIGFEFRGQGEFGAYTKLTFLDDSNSIEKIFIRKDFFSNLEVPYDSIFIIEPKLNKVTIYSNENRKGEELLSSPMIEHAMFDVNEEIEQIKNWKK